MEVYFKEHSNVNGKMLRLGIKHIESFTNGLQFEVTYVKGENENKSGLNVVIALAVNVSALYYLHSNIACSIITGLVIFFAWLFWVMKTILAESVMILPGIGIQCATTHACGVQRNLIKWNCIKDVAINEVIIHQKVLYYLTVIMEDHKGKKSLHPLFTHTKPRLVLLEKMYQEVQPMFDNDKTDEESECQGG